jgi:hypothetical protein
MIYVTVRKKAVSKIENNSFPLKYLGHNTPPKHFHGAIYSFWLVVVGMEVCASNLLETSFEGETCDVNDVLAEFPHGSDASEGPIQAKKLQGSFDDVARSESSCLKVYLRVRPPSSDSQSTVAVVSETDIMTTAPENSNRAKFTRTEERQYTFSRIFGPDSHQTHIFEHVAIPLIRKFEDGDSCVLFAYGITNAGKTHTIQGTRDDPGILPKLISHMLSNSAEDGQIDLQLSMLEIYQEQIFDLLSKKKEKLSIRDGSGKVDVPRLSYHRIASNDDAFKLMQQGASKRSEKLCS